jgi:hypothetical protein
MAASKKFNLSNQFPNAIIKTIIRNSPQLLIIGFALFTVLSFLVISTHIQPQFDDFDLGNKAKYRNLIDFVYYWYNNWSGRYTAITLLYLLSPTSYQMTAGYGTIAIILQIIFLITLYYFTKTFFSKNKNILDTFTIYSCILLPYYWQLPSPAEAFYWAPSALSYQLGVILLMLFFAYYRNKKNELNVYNKGVLVLLSTLIPGTSEISIVIFTIFLSSYIVFNFINRKYEIFLLFVLAIGILFSILSMLAPGNSVRTIEMSAISAKSNDLSFATKYSIIFLKTSLLNLFMRSPFILLLLLFSWILIKSQSKIETSKKIGLISLAFYLLFWGIILFAIHFPFLYKSGIEHMPGRILNISHLTLVIGFMGFTYLIINLTKKSELENNHSFTSIILILVFVQLLFQFLLPNKILRATDDLLSGNSKNYSETLIRRFETLRKSQNQHVTLIPITNIPSTVFIADVTSDTSATRNKQVELFFNLASIRMDSSKVKNDSENE